MSVSVGGDTISGCVVSLGDKFRETGGGDPSLDLI